MKLKVILAIGALVPCFSFAFKNSATTLGFGLYSQNFLNKTAQAETGKTSFMGASSTPIHVKYDYSIFDDWFVAPQLSHTLSPRKAEGNSADITMTHLAFLIGKNFEGSGSDWDWYVGPGLLQQVIDGKGGTVQLLNGSTPTTFYKPGNTETIKKVSMVIGTSYAALSSRFALDLILENAFSEEKRSQSLMVSYGYTFGDSGGGGGGSRSRSRPRGRTR